MHGQNHIKFLEINFNIIDPSVPRSSKCPIYLYFPKQNSVCPYLLSYMCYIGFTYLTLLHETHSLHIHSTYETANLEIKILIHSVHWVIAGSGFV